MSSIRKNRIYPLLLRIAGGNRISVRRGNAISLSDAHLHNCVIKVRGENNSVDIAPGCKLRNCRIIINGSGNHLQIGADSLLVATTMALYGEDGEMILGESIRIHGETYLGVEEGTSLKIGEGSLFATRIRIATSDSHKIYDAISGGHLNPGRNIRIGRRVWVAYGATILKGVEIADDCVIGANSVVTKSISESHCAIAGNPARVNRRGIIWKY